MKQFPQFLGRGTLIAGLFASSLLPAVADTPLTPVTQQEVRQEHGTFAKLAKALKPAVVNIIVEKRVTKEKSESALDMLPELFDERGSKKRRYEARETGQGSGVVISNDGFILTNNHVVSDARTVKVTLFDGRELDAKVVGTDPKTDLALVKVDGHNLPFANLGDSDALEVGDWVMAIGNPFGLDATVTVGVLSGKGREIGSGPYDDYLQTDASINPGNSGGPLFNTAGQVVGINTAIISHSQGIGFAVPINMAKEVALQLKSAGHMTRGYLGVGVQRLQPNLRKALGISEKVEGVLVSQVPPAGPAYKAGVKLQDVVTAINGHPIHSERELVMVASHLPVGKAAEISVVRAGQPATVAVTVSEHPDDKPTKSSPQAVSLKTAPQEDLGLEVAPLSADLAAELKTKDLSGVVVADVERNSAAQRAGLEPGDIIRKINSQPVTNLDQFVKAIKGQKNLSGVAFLVERHGSTRFMVVEI